MKQFNNSRGFAPIMLLTILTVVLIAFVLKDNLIGNKLDQLLDPNSQITYESEDEDYELEDEDDLDEVDELEDVEID